MQCHCGWEDAVGEGIQEGFVGVLKRRFGFITKEYPREPNPKGIYFRELDLKDYSIAQLNIGDRVHFVVNQNDKGCVAQQIDVLRVKAILMTLCLSNVFHKSVFAVVLK